MSSHTHCSIFCKVIIMGFCSSYYSCHRYKRALVVKFVGRVT